MENLNEISTLVCKSLRALGMSKYSEHQVENHLMIQLKSSGPEYVISRLKELREWRIRAMVSTGSYDAPEWFKHSHGERPHPSGWEGALWSDNPKKTFACVGALLNAITLRQVSRTQLRKFLSGVRLSPRVEASEALSKCHGLRPASPAVCKRLNSRIERAWKTRPFFSTVDIHGSSIPIANLKMTIRKDKDGYPKESDLVAARLLSLDTAPACAWDHLREMGYVPPVFADDPYSTASVWLPYLDESFHRASDLYSFADQVDEQNPLLDAETVEAYAGTVGHISFLQKPSGKLRSVANPNRFIQWTTEVFGETLSDFVNSRPGVYVKDQLAGLDAIQRLLQEGREVYSFDLTSATDTLDFRAFTQRYFKNVEPGSALAKELEYFEFVSGMPWQLPREASQQLVSDRIQWKAGQPLGLRPSFALLTLMNWEFANNAFRQYLTDHPDDPTGLMDRFRETGVPPYAVVGDDFACVSELAPYYKRICEAYGGILNFEKTMHSDLCAEFCSQLITRRGNYPLKPKWSPEFSEIVDNYARFRAMGLSPNVPHWVSRCSRELAKYQLDERWLAKAKGDKLPLPNRVLYEMISKTLEEKASDPVTITPLTAKLRLQESLTDDHPLGKRVLNAIRDVYAHAYQGPWPEGARLPLVLGNLDLTIPKSTHYEYKVDRYVPDKNKLTSYRQVLLRMQHYYGNTINDQDGPGVLVPLKTRIRVERGSKPVTALLQLVLNVDVPYIRMQFEGPGATELSDPAIVPLPDDMQRYVRGLRESYLRTRLDEILRPLENGPVEVETTAKQDESLRIDESKTSLGHQSLTQRKERPSRESGSSDHLGARSPRVLRFGSGSHETGITEGLPSSSPVKQADTSSAKDEVTHNSSHDSPGCGSRKVSDPKGHEDRHPHETVLHLPDISNVRGLDEDGHQIPSFGCF